jgi:type VI secretion system secreted protein VgrG
MLELIAECEALSKSLAEFAANQKAFAQEGKPLADFRKAASEWEQGTNTSPESGEAKPIAAITAPSGIGLATESELVCYAGANVDQVAQLNLQLTAGQRCVVNAGKGVSLFAHSDGLKAIANKGRVLVQSQGDAMDINAAQDLTLTSSEGKLVGMAKEIVLVAEDGSFIKIGSGITIGTNGTINYHAAKHPFQGGKTMSAALPTFKSGETNVRVVTRYERGTPRETSAPDKSIQIAHEGGRMAQVRSGKDGKTEAITANEMLQVKVTPIERSKG